MKNKILYWSPRILSIMFVAFLCLFSLDVFDEFEGWRTLAAMIIHLAVPAIVLLGTILAWKRPLVGTFIFCFFAVYYVYMVGLDRHWSWYVSISGPALLTAILFFVDWVRGRRHDATLSGDI